MTSLTHADPLEILLAKERSEVLRQAFRSLSPNERDMLALVYVGGVPAQVVGKVLGFSAGVVQTYCWRARRRMRTYLRNHGEEV